MSKHGSSTFSIAVMDGAVSFFCVYRWMHDLMSARRNRYVQSLVVLSYSASNASMAKCDGDTTH